MIAVLKKGKQNSALTSEEKALIERVKRIELTDLDSQEVASSTTCAGYAKNAYYNQVGHNLSICPGMIMASDASLIFVISHEIGHAIDPCSSTMSFWEVDQEKFKTFINDPTLSPDTKKDLSSVISTSTKYINFDLSIYINDENIFKKLTTTGALKKVQEGNPTDIYPFKKEYKCFVNNNYFRETSTQDISITKEYIQRKVGPEIDKSVTKKTIDRYFAAIDKHPQCLKTLTPASQMSETMSDMDTLLIPSNLLIQGNSNSLQKV